MFLSASVFHLDPWLIAGLLWRCLGCSERFSPPEKGSCVLPCIHEMSDVGGHWATLAPKSPNGLLHLFISVFAYQVACNSRSVAFAVDMLPAYFGGHAHGDQGGPSSTIASLDRHHHCCRGKSHRFEFVETFRRPKTARVSCLFVPCAFSDSQKESRTGIRGNGALITRQTR